MLPITTRAIVQLPDVGVSVYTTPMPKAGVWLQTAQNGDPAVDPFNDEKCELTITDSHIYLRATAKQVRQGPGKAQLAVGMTLGPVAGYVAGSVAAALRPTEAVTPLGDVLEELFASGRVLVASRAQVRVHCYEVRSFLARTEYHVKVSGPFLHAKGEIDCRVVFSASSSEPKTVRSGFDKAGIAMTSERAKSVLAVIEKETGIKL